ncbi:hypothetical protein ACFLXM_02190 [Chloroflexota bacterium]
MGLLSSPTRSRGLQRRIYDVMLACGETQSPSYQLDREESIERLSEFTDCPIPKSVVCLPLSITIIYDPRFTIDINPAGLIILVI